MLLKAVVLNGPGVLWPLQIRLHRLGMFQIHFALHCKSVLRSTWDIIVGLLSFTDVGAQFSLSSSSLGKIFSGCFRKTSNSSAALRGSATGCPSFFRILVSASNWKKSNSYQLIWNLRFHGSRNY